MPNLKDMVECILYLYRPVEAMADSAVVRGQLDHQQLFNSNYTLKADWSAENKPIYNWKSEEQG